MRIARFNGGRIGLVIDETVRDVTDAAEIDPQEWPPVGVVRMIASFAGVADKLRLFCLVSRVPVGRIRLGGAAGSARRERPS